MKATTRTHYFEIITIIKTTDPFSSVGAQREVLCSLYSHLENPCDFRWFLLLVVVLVWCVFLAHTCVGTCTCRDQRRMSNVFIYHSPFCCCFCLFLESGSLAEKGMCAAMFGFWRMMNTLLWFSCLYRKCS